MMSTVTDSITDEVESYNITDEVESYNMLERKTRISKE